jgi:hypothetical protein
VISIMDFELSPALARVLCLQDGKDFARQIDLPAAADRLVESLANQREAARLLLAKVAGVTKAEVLLQEIGRFLPFDSTVRDLATSGHLGKLLARSAIYERLRDYRVYALPNELFDGLSWDERNAFFRKGVCHTFDGDLFQIAEIARMLASEQNIMRSAGREGVR